MTCFREHIRAQIIVGTFFCLFSAGKICVLPFLTLLFRHVGLTALQAGILRAAQSVVSMVFSPILIHVAKTYHKQKIFVLAGLVVMAVSYISLTFVPQITNQEIQEVKCDERQCQESINQVQKLNKTNIHKKGNYTKKSEVNSSLVIAESFNHSDVIRNNSNHEQIDSIQKPVYSNVLKNINNASALNKTRHENLHHNSSDSWFLKSKSSADQPVFHPCFSYSNSNFKSHGSDIKDMWCLQRLATFLVFLVVLLLCEVLGSPVERLVDDSWYEHLEEIDTLEVYGEHKTYVAGFTAIILLGSCGIVSTMPPHLSFNLRHFFFYFYIFFTIMCIAMVFTPFLPVPNSKSHPATNYKKILRSFQIIFCDYRTLLFTVSVILSGAFNACIHDFLLWHLQNEGAKEYLLGLIICFGIASEIPIPIIYKTVIRTITLNGTVAVALFIYGFRFMYYSLVWSPMWVLLAQLLQGLSSALMWQAILVHIDQVSNPGMDRNVHSLLYSLYWGVGYSIGTLLGGFLFEYFGAHLMFWVFGISAFAWGLIFLIMQWYMPQLQRRTYSKLLLSGTDDRERMYRLLNSSQSDSEDEWMKVLEK